MIQNRFNPLQRRGKMINKMADQIYQLKVPIPYDMGDVNCYLIKGEDGFTIVDTGDHTEEAKILWTKVLSEGIPVEKLVLTHSHPDHVGLAGWFQKQFNIPVWMSTNSYKEVQRIRTSFEGEKSSNSQSSLLYLHGLPTTTNQDNEFKMVESYEFEPSHLFEDHEEIQLGNIIFETLWTPGHSPDHFCFYNQQNEILLAGDHILNDINPIVMSQSVGDNPLKNYIHSLDKIKNYPTQYVLTGHGEPITNLSRRIEEMKMHYQKRWKQAYESILEQGSSAYQISQIIYGKELSLHRSISAFIQTITNLVYLESVGKVKMEEQSGRVYFYRN